MPSGVPWHLIYEVVRDASLAWRGPPTPAATCRCLYPEGAGAGDCGSLEQLLREQLSRPQPDRAPCPPAPAPLACAPCKEPEACELCTGPGWWLLIVLVLLALILGCAGGFCCGLFLPRLRRLVGELFSEEPVGPPQSSEVEPSTETVLPRGPLSPSSLRSRNVVTRHP